MNNDKQKKVIPLLREIASRLWDGRAAVLVGAGFSRNAQPTSSSSRKFPMWNDLGDLFYGKIYCDKNSNKYSNVLKLADEVDAAFGRSALEKIILDNVPDKEYEPSELHKQLLNLPWSDVFTTNYDTLLERACVFVDSKKYDIVINKNDLINAEKPRIVKLHGSFPSERPFIITEEDYRCYPKNFSPFVNTVQQSLIENTLCLIGFSGDDPNFLNWIGWIRDNLDEKNSPKIFLISLSDFNEAQRKLLERRNIIIIDLSLLGDFNGDHARAHLAFIDFINTNKKKEVDINWPQNNSSSAQNIYHNESIDEKKNKTLKAKDIWLKDRENYPGWCIAPEDNRKSLWAKTREWLNIFDEIDSWDFGEDLEIAFELNWRIKTCLLPIFDNTASGMKTIIEKYANSFLNKDPYPRNISLQLPPLIISMLRYHRQENDNNNWNNLHTLALKCKNLFNLHDEASLNYESVLFSFHNLRIEEALDKLSKWEKNELLPFVEAKRAGLLAELGHVDDAISILENSLNTLRKNNFSTSKHADFSISSQEAYIMLLLYFIKRNNGRTLKSSNEAYHLRWAKLSQFKCDPMVELKIFEIRLEGYSNESKEVSEKNNFDIGKRTTSLGFGFSNINKIVLDSFSFLIFCEEMGLPPRIPKTSIVKNTFGKAAAVIYEHCPGWALFTLLRIGDEKIIGSFFGRSLISKIGRDDVQESIDSHFLALKACHLKIKSLNEEESKHLYISFIKCLTELISRLITKSSYSKKTEIIEFICILFNDPNFDEIAYFSNLLERTINSLSSEQKIETLPVFLKFPARPLNNRIRPHNFTNPFLFITDLVRTDTQTLKIKISNQEITNFINEIKNANDESRIIPSVTMIVLYQLGYLSQSNVKRLIKSLWIKVDEFGFPSNAGYRRFYFIKNLHPNDINTRDLMMEYIKTKDFPIAAKGENGIPLGNGQNEYCAELLGSINYIEYPQEIITSILLSLESWFNHDKELLNKKNVDIKNQIDKNFEVLIRIVTKLFIKFEGNFSKEADEIINRLVLNMQDYGLRVTPILVLLNRGGLSKINELDKLCDSLYSNESKVILRTLRSISDLLGAEIDCSELLLCLADKIKWNAEPEIKHCLEIAERAITEITFIEKDKFINVVITGLKRILEDQVNDKLDGSIYLDSLETKINAAKVALSIYKKSISEKETINKVILDWKHLCESSEEFDEVKNSWIS